MGGDSTFEHFGIYGTQGVASAANKPGERKFSISWTDGSGKLWLFGGEGPDASHNYGYLNDLWKYDPSTNQWTWINGDSTIYTAGVYGIKGVAAPANKPGHRG